MTTEGHCRCLTLCRFDDGSIDFFMAPPTMLAFQIEPTAIDKCLFAQRNRRHETHTFHIAGSTAMANVRRSDYLAQHATCSAFEKYDSPTTKKGLLIRLGG